MILEIARLSIKAGQELLFEAAVSKAEAVFRNATGCRSMNLRRSVEHPSQYGLFVTWNSIDDHLIGFKNSVGIEEWRKLVGEYFSSPPQIEHFETVSEGFDQ